MAGVKKQIRVRVDRERCVGAAMCVAIAPSVFAIDAEGKAVVLVDTFDDTELLMQAAEECPALAVIVVDSDTDQQLFP